MSWDAETITLDDADHFETLNGLWTGKKPPFVHAGVIRNTNFTESGRIDYSDVAWLQVEQKQLSKRQLKPGDIIVERSGGGPKQPVGRVVFFTHEDSPFSFSNFTSAIRVRDTQTFNAKFVFYGLLELYQSGRTEDIQRHTTGIRNLDFTAYKERAAFPQIALAEQRKIAGVLELVQRALEQQERLIALTTELKKTLLHQLFTQGLRGEPQKQTEIGPVPESWEVMKLRDLCDLIVDCPHTTPKFQTEGIRVARNFNIRAGRFVTAPAFYTTKEEYQQRIERAEPLPGDILFSREAPVGEACAIPEGMKLSLGQRTMLLRASEGKLDAQFMVYCFYAPNVRPRMLASSSGLTVPHLNVADVRDLSLPIPPLCDQQQIATAILTVDTKGECHRKKHAALTALFRTLLHQLMTAQIRVNSLDLSELGLDKERTIQQRSCPAEGRAKAGLQERQTPTEEGLILS